MPALAGSSTAPIQATRLTSNLVRGTMPPDNRLGDGAPVDVLLRLQRQEVADLHRLRRPLHRLRLKRRDRMLKLGYFTRAFQ